MSDYTIYQQGHCTYTCQYHIVWITKYRKALLKNKSIKQEITRILKLICKWKGFTILAWHIGAEHIHLYIIIPPKYSISYAMSIIKGKSSTFSDLFRSHLHHFIKQHYGSLRESRIIYSHIQFNKLNYIRVYAFP